MFHGNRMSAKLFLVCDPADGCAAGPQGCKRDVGRNMLKRLLPRMQQSQITDHRSQRLKAELSHTATTNRARAVKPWPFYSTGASDCAITACTEHACPSRRHKTCTTAPTFRKSSPNSPT